MTNIIVTKNIYFIIQRGKAMSNKDKEYTDEELGE